MTMILDPEGLIYTLELPEEGSVKAVLKVFKKNERAIAGETGKGSLIPKDLLRQIVFLNQNSALFDPKPFKERMGPVFLDGAHSPDYVRNDTEKGLRMLRKRRVMAKHDCTPSHRNVVHYLHSFPQKIVLFGRTTFAFACKGGASEQA